MYGIFTFFYPLQGFIKRFLVLSLKILQEQTQTKGVALGVEQHEGIDCAAVKKLEESMVW